MQWFIFTIISLIFFITPFQKGLYFNENVYPISIISFLIFIVFIIRQFISNEINMIKKPMLVLLLPLCYLLSLPFAESPEAAWASFLRWVFYSCFFILLTWSASKQKMKEILPFLFQMAGACLALSMMLTYYGVIHDTDAFVNHRYAGIFQYPNTFGMVMAMFFFFSIIQLTEEKLLVKKLCLDASLCLIYFVCFIQSYSRGMLMFFPVIWLIGLLLLPFKKQLSFLINSIITILSSLVVYESMVRGELSGSSYPGLWLFVVMLIIAITTIYLIQFKWLKNDFAFVLKANQIKGSRFVLPVIIVVTFLLGALDITHHGLVYQQLPAKLQDRLGNISLSTPTAKERLTLYKDAVSMSKSSPVIGHGGGGWGALYKKFQSAPYLTNKVHNGYIEWIIETGWIGFILFIMVFVYYFYLLFQSYFAEKNSSSKIAIIIALLTIFSHSFIDFNFSYGTVWLLVFWLFSMGLANQREENHVIKEANTSWKYKGVLIIFTCILFIGIIQSYRFITAGQVFSKALETNNVLLKESLLRKSVDLDPYNINYMKNLAEVEIARFKQVHHVDDQKKAEQLVFKMAKIEPRNSTVLFQSAILSEQMRNAENAIKYYDDALKVDHFNTLLYQNSISLKVKMAIDFRKRQNEEKSHQMLNSALSDYQQEKYWYGKIGHSKAEDIYNSREFHITPATQYYAGMAYLIKKDYTQVLKIANEVKTKEKIKDHFLALKILANEKLGLKNEMKYSRNISYHVENLRKIMKD